MKNANKIELLKEPLINQINYNTDLQTVEENEELFFFPAEEITEEQAERDTVYSLLAEMRGM